MKKAVLLGVSALLFLVFAYTQPAQAHQSLTVAPEPTYYLDFGVHGPKGRIMRTARSYAGTKYRPVRWNCSDYTRQVYGEAVGVWLPDWDSKQVYYGYHPDHLERADLVFFDEVPHDGDRITHVAVYAGKVNGRKYVWQNSSYYGMVVKTRMGWITDSLGNPAFVPHYTRRIR